MAREYLWVPGKGYTEKAEGKENAKSNTAQRGINRETASAPGAVAAQPGAACERDATSFQPGPDSDDPSSRDVSQCPNGRPGPEHDPTGSGTGDDRHADEGHAGAPPWVEIFEEDRSIRVDFDDMLDIARRTRVSGDGNKP